MPKREIDLTEHQAAIVDALVRSGRYADADAVIGEGLRLIERAAAKHAARLKALREAARIGFEALDRHEYKEFADTDELVRYLDEMSETIIADVARR